MALGSSVETIHGVGPALGNKLEKLGIITIEDLWNYYPRKYNDFSHIQRIKDIRPGAVTIKATVKQVAGRYVRRGMHITEAVVSDSSGSVRLIWFNQPYRINSLKKEVEYFISGNFEFGHQRLSVLNPSCERVSDFPVNTARIVPVYRESKDINSNTIRKMLKNSVDDILGVTETLPDWICRKHTLTSLSEALVKLHFPSHAQDVETAKKRLGFEEVFSLILSALMNKEENNKDRALEVSFNKDLAQAFVKHLPFTLTNSQRKVVWQIYQDMAKKQPMNRLLEGDVGSGKTVVATMAALMALEQGFQVALMAPTELLALQHADTVYALLMPLGLEHSVTLLTGSVNASQKNKIHNRIAKSTSQFIIGTHALISEKVKLPNLGLVIIDEQHRFGVEQRKKLSAKAGHAVHVLSMTATPIPRTLALTLYGELDISVLDEKPANRKPVITRVCSPNSRNQLYETIESQLSAGRQLFVVAPAIRDDVKSQKVAVESVFNSLASSRLRKWRIGLLHGKLSPVEKINIMGAFTNHKLDILVSTTVIEVGVDVPNATMMIIEQADSFGLAQLHQLRGRVGRSEHQGFCYLMMSDSSKPSPRLKAMEQTHDGFKLAELDFELRGPGTIYGIAQHGVLDLRMAKLSDSKLVESAREAALEFIERKENLLNYKHLSSRITKLRAITNLN